MLKKILFLLYFAFGVGLGVADAPATTPSVPNLAPVNDLILFTHQYTNTPPLTAGTNDSDVAVLTSKLLERTHYI